MEALFHKHWHQISIGSCMVLSSSSSVCYMFLLGTFPFWDVIELDIPLQIEVLSYVDQLFIYTLCYCSATALWSDYEASTFMQQSLLLQHFWIYSVPHLSILIILFPSSHTLFGMGSFLYLCLVSHYMQIVLVTEFDLTSCDVQWPNLKTNFLNSYLPPQYLHLFEGDMMN